MARGFDLAYVRREIPMAEVLAQLKLETDGRRYRCWRQVKHKRKFTLSIFRKKNAARCFECHRRVLSTIDVVVEALGVDVSAALRWFGERWQVPRRELIGGRSRAVAPPGSVPSLEAFVLSEMFPALSHAAQSLAIVLLTHAMANPEGKVQIAGIELQRRTGIANRRTLRRAQLELVERRLFERWLDPTGNFSERGWRADSWAFRLTWQGFAWGECSQVNKRSEVNASECALLPTSSVHFCPSIPGRTDGCGKVQAWETEPGRGGEPVENSEVVELLGRYMEGHKMPGSQMTPEGEAARREHLQRQKVALLARKGGLLQ
jgi:hypothetical protein